MRRLVIAPSAALLLAVSVALCAGCGSLDEESTGEDVEVSRLEGLDAPADYAGGYYVRVKGALTVGGATKTGTFSGRDSYAGYTLTSKSGDALKLRAVTSRSMTLLAVYGPQAADGSWGAQRAHTWRYDSSDAQVGFLAYTTPRAGKYLVVVATPRRTASFTETYALTACDGACVVATCAEWTRPDTVYFADNFVSRGEAAAAISAELGTDRTFRSGACGAQPRTCAADSTRVCSNGVAFANACKARIAMRDSVGDVLGNYRFIVVTPKTAAACAP